MYYVSFRQIITNLFLEYTNKFAIMLTFYLQLLMSEQNDYNSSKSDSDWSVSVFIC